MGRRDVSVHDEARWVFNRLATDYQRRPGYPDALVRRLAALAESGWVADVGAGTGHLSLPLAELGLEVFAIEPACAMLEVLRSAARLAGVSVHARHAAAEDMRLPARSFQLVLFADAVQWVDPERAGREAGRLLAPDGVCATVEAKLGETSFLVELGRLISRYNPKAPTVSAPVRGEGAFDSAAPSPARRGDAAVQLLSLATQGGRIRSERFTHTAPLETEALAATLRSMSFIGPALGEPALGRLLVKAGELARAAGGARWERTLTLRWARAEPPRARARRQRLRSGPMSGTR